MAAEPDSTGGPLNDLTGFQRDALAVVARLDRPNGLTVKGELESWYNTNDIGHGRLYPNLDTLAEMDLVEKGEVDRRTNYYTLTRRGRRELRAHHSWIGESL